MQQVAAALVDQVLHIVSLVTVAASFSLNLAVFRLGYYKKIQAFIQYNPGRLYKRPRVIIFLNAHS